MGKIIPKLNLNSHYRDAEHNSIVGATNMMVSNDYFTLQTEVGTKVNEIITNYISIVCPDGYKIIYAIPCNKEIVFFVKDDTQDDLYLFRYNEDENKCIDIINNFEYNGGELIGTFTYNYDNLIIAISEYNGIKDIPLRVINLGKFNNQSPIDDEIDKLQLYDNTCHTICPEVKIPIINSIIKSGNAYKGWYYIFIRYKIGTDNYTQWFNTNESLYLDNYSTENIIDYYVSDYYDKDETKTVFRGIATSTVSDNKDICSLSFSCNVEKLDDKFKYYQLGFVCINKIYTKAFITSDLNINVKEFIFSDKTVNEYSAVDLIKTYYNYYNVKTIENYNNRLYIANYKENINEKNIDTSEIKLTIGHIVQFFDIEENNKNDIEESKSIAIIKSENEIVHKADINIVDGIKYIKLIDCFLQHGNIQTRLNVNDDTDIIINYYDMSGGEGSGLQDSSTHKAKNIVYYQISNDKWGWGTIINDKIKSIENNNNYTFEFVIKEEYIRYSSAMYNYNIEISEISIIKKDIKSNINQLNHVGVLPNNYYNFYIHFVDKYGITTKGIQINKFNLNFDTNTNKILNVITNEIDCLLLKPNIDWVDNEDDEANARFKRLLLRIKLDKIPNNYIGYFVSYEKLEKSVLYSSIVNINNNVIRLYNDRFNYDDTLNFNFDKISVHQGDFIISQSEEVTYDRKYKYTSDNWNEITNINVIESKTLRVADSFGNILKSTNIETSGIKDNDNEINNSLGIIENTIDTTTLYIKELKELIPCSNIQYDTNKYVKVNTKNGFITLQHALIYEDNIYYNDAIKVYQKNNESNAITNPLLHYKWYYWDDKLHESIQYNNKPVITMFPIKGLEDDSLDPDRSFAVGNIIEAKNTIDLYKQNNVAIYDLHPKVLDYYNPKLKYITNFNNTIRRSNVIQDENSVISWRLFESDNYININENKGSIIKITGIGTIMLIHTEHSLFQFSSDNSLKTNKDENVQLVNVDIWDIKYKEILTSKLGYGGIKKEHHAIVGEFGYIFYDTDGDKFYRFDNGQLKRIDEKIINYLKSYQIGDVKFVDDKLNNRVLLSMLPKNPLAGSNDFRTLSYNYIINDFISEHTYYIKNGYSTKNKIYLTSDDKNISEFYRSENGYAEINPYFNNRYIFEGLQNNGQSAEISILCNIEYETIKFLEYIKYKLYKLEQGSHNRLNNKINYSGDKVIIYNEFNNTQELDFGNKYVKQNPFTGVLYYITDTDEYEQVLNEFMDYTKPCFRIGNWYFNYIRNKILNNNALIDNDSTILCGNYFIITFKFKNNKLIELDSIDYKVNKDIIE